MAVPSDGLQDPEISDVESRNGQSMSTDGHKRKREADDKPLSKRAAKRKKSKAATDSQDDGFDLEKGLNLTIAHMDAQLLGDYIAEKNKRLQPDLSTLELEETRIAASSITDSSTWRKPRDLDNLPKFLEHYAGTNSKNRKPRIALDRASQTKGQPHTLVVAGAGLRAADLTRALRRFQSRDAMVAKLFAKHIKLKEAAEMVRGTRIGIGVGTPQRLIDLLDDGALSTAMLDRIVIDTSHVDSKKRGILDMREILAPLMKLLSRPDLKDRFGAEENKLELLFY